MAIIKSVCCCSTAVNKKFEVPKYTYIMLYTVVIAIGQMLIQHANTNMLHITDIEIFASPIK